MGRSTPGNYVPLDINFARDSAVRAAGPLPELLYLRGLAYCKGSRSDGYIPDYDLPAVAVGITGAARHAKALEQHQLWVKVEGGWLVRSWQRWNASDQASSEAGKRGNHKRWHVALKVVRLDCEFCQTDRPPIAPRSQPDSPPDPIVRSGRESQGKGSSVAKATGRTPSPPDPNPTARTLVAEWIDAQRRRPPDAVVGPVAKHVGALLTEGFDVEHIRAGLERLSAKQLHPSTLPSLVNEAVNGPRHGIDADEVAAGWDV